MRFIIHLDLNSFFATVEQQANPFLRGRPIGVAGRPGGRSVVAAASIEAKRLGVKTAMGTQEAQSVCPEITLVAGDNEQYHAVAKRVVDIIIRYTPQVEIFSLDECFADVTQQANDWQAAADLICNIKADIRREIGDYMSCSVGLAPNKFLAKLASDTFKPDGLQVVLPNDWRRRWPVERAELVRVLSTGSRRSRLKIVTVDELTLGVELDEFCGIGSRIKRHLARLSIKTVADLRVASLPLLQRVFGVVGQQLQQYAYGYDERPVVVHYDQPAEQSFSHSITLPAQYYTPEAAQRFLYHQCERVGRRLRARGFAARQIVAFVRFGDLTGWGGHRTLKEPIRDGRAIYNEAADIIHNLKTFKPIRLVGVAVRLLIPLNQLTWPLLPEERRADSILDALDAVNNVYGEGTVLRASAMAVKDAQTSPAHAFGFHFHET